MLISESACLLVCLSVRLFDCQFVCQSACMSVCLCASLFFLFVYLVFACLLICFCVRVFCDRLRVYLLDSLFVSVFVSLCICSFGRLVVCWLVCQSVSLSD